MTSAQWKQLVDEKRAHRDSQIPEQWRVPKQVADQVSPDADVSAFDLLAQANLLSREELDITENYDATALLGLLALGKLTSLQVTTAFCKRAAIAQQLVRMAV